MAKPETFYTLLLDGNLREFALVSLPKKAQSASRLSVRTVKAWPLLSARPWPSQVLPSQLVSVQVRQGKGAFSDTRSVALMANLIGHLRAYPLGILVLAVVGN